MTLRRAVVLLAVGALAGCGGGGGASGRVHGTVTLGPTSQPASGAKVTFTPVGGAPTIVVTASDGSYSVSLAPGVYGVAVSAPLPSRSAINAVAHVTAGQDRKLDFQIDSGSH